jgi:multiple sugar transport system substrate-binding protein
MQTLLGELAGERFAAAYVLLAQAAPMARHPNQLAILFDLESMRPQIDGPPFVRALEELAAQAAAGESEASTGVEWWMWWPAASGSAQSRQGGTALAVLLPESDVLFNPDSKSWEAPPDGVARATLMGANSYVGSVTTVSKNAPAAFRLLAWLAARSGRGGRVSIAPYRVEASDELLASALSERGGLEIPRILAVDDYLAALDQGVRDALEGRVAPEAALRSAAREWEAITERVGRDRQRAAYQKHLNLK